MGGGLSVRFAEMAAARPVFHPEIGAFFQKLRTDKGWSQRQAADIAHRRRIPVTTNVLWRLERGKIKNPEPETLRALAELYELPYEQLALWVVEQLYGADLLRRYGVDLPRHGRDQDSTPHRGGVDDPSAARRLSELTALREERDRYKAALDQITDVARRLVEIAAGAAAGQGRAATGHEARGRGRRRKTG